jgi:hypothetical protein
VNTRSASRAPFQWLEGLLAVAILVCGLICAKLTIDKGYFPPPFFFDTENTFGDWFNTAVWAHQKGAYDTWLTVYPPLTFVLLKFVGLPACYGLGEMSSMRDCDWVGIVAIHLSYAAAMTVASLSFLKVDRKTALPRGFALAAGMPALFGLERGNVIFFCYICVMLGWGPLLRSARLRWLFAGLAVNFKVYLIAGVLVQLVRRRWLWVEGALISIVLVYLVSFLILGEGTPVEIVANLVNFAEGFYGTQADVLSFWYANTFSPLYNVLTDSAAPAASLIGDDLVKLGAIVSLVSMRTGQGLALLALLAAWIRPEAVTPQRLTLLALSFVLITQETSAYTQPIVFFFVFLERWKGWLVPIAITLTYLVSLPGDIMLGNGGLHFTQYSYIATQWVLVERGMAAGMILRPLALVLVTSLFAVDTIASVVKDVRQDGSQWRWRFRNDAPILPRVRAPHPPVGHNTLDGGAPV